MNPLNMSFDRGARVKLYALLAIVSLLVLGWLAVGSAAAGGNRGNRGNGGWRRGYQACHGTYLIDFEESPALWSFSADGNFHGTDAEEQELDFSHLHGVWKRTWGGEVALTYLDFNYGVDRIARIDGELEFDRDCDSLEGTLDLRFYDYPDEDPLVPGGGELVEEDIEFSGRRLHPAMMMTD